MRRFRIGNAIITKISELDLDGVEPSFLYPGADPASVLSVASSLSAGSYDRTTRTLRQSIHTWLVQIEGRTILIDTATGNDKERPTIPPLDRLNEPYLDRLAEAGVLPDAVDAVLMTHIHADHVGWNTRLHDGLWVPVFPNAQHYFSGIEADYGAAIDAGNEMAASALRDAADLGPMTHPPTAGVYKDSVAPIAAAGLANRIVADRSEVIPGFSYHALPGHSIDHAAILLESGGEQALFWGDVFHHPVQVTHPEWNSVFCEFPAAAVRSRRQALELAAHSGATVFTTHFAESSAGHVRRESDGSYRWNFTKGERL
ncbi:MBL fold metallo-hydrolase [Paracoccus onubensis]|uniref:MBL fold metallo-hydrolase n=1 Tax=Paracoccus onubensis TaxID=1675788 RepID=UPI002730354E|nr:MBL fold metallo-hydrolase [Paracoccus onubensis]MDP0929890.1 MBL fold metallo-hydrolase [Paracoccus onubensis]